jgi:hemin uptake protein HemP
MSRPDTPQGQALERRTPGERPPLVQAVRTIDSLSLFGAAQQVLIAHQGETYKLQITRQGKLILTK